jgi:hypothetical protein
MADARKPTWPLVRFLPGFKVDGCSAHTRGMRDQGKYFRSHKQKTPPEGSVLMFLVARGGIEPPTQGFSILCSTD